MKIKRQIAALMTATTLASTSPMLADGPAHMTPETMLTLARVGSGALSPDGKLVVYSVDPYRVLHHQCTGYWPHPDHQGDPRPELPTMDPAGATHQLPL